MLRLRREPAHGFLDDCRLDLLEFGARLSGHPFRERGAGGDGGRAPACFVTDFGGAVALETDGQAQNIAANGIRDLDRDRGWLEIADIARILKMIEKALA